MNCQKCGATIGENEKFCSVCGTAIADVKPANQTYEQPSFSQKMQSVINGTTYLVWSIIVTVMCCIPLGIPAIIYATKIENAQREGNYEYAAECAKKSKLFSIWGAVASAVFLILYFVFVVGLGLLSMGIN